MVCPCTEHQRDKKRGCHFLRCSHLFLKVLSDAVLQQMLLGASVWDASFIQTLIPESAWQFQVALKNQLPLMGESQLFY